MSLWVNAAELCIAADEFLAHARHSQLNACRYAERTRERSDSLCEWRGYVGLSKRSYRCRELLLGMNLSPKRIPFPRNA